MLAKRIIPCLDIDNGRVVKGTNFVNIKDAGDPIERAKCYDQQGADELVFLDITASSSKREILIDLVRETAAHIFIPFTVGGGIRSVQTIHDLLRAGADKVSLNSAAIESPDLIKEGSSIFGSQCIVVAIDFREIMDLKSIKPHPNPALSVSSTSRWEVFTHGGRKGTGIDAIKWATYAQSLGAGELLATSMDHDGTQSGYALDCLRALSKQLSIPIIASGGAGNCDHIIDALACSDAALLASLLHFGHVTIPEIKEQASSHGFSVRKTRTT